ncbi:hypothetical protein HII31_10642 [Pseudocercospora fuligena]|uniref:Uncharacterized protein n=1 Tax=Pseudocercospora fuligena TaxID=685502 RepID=A0A8H6RA10_9PEZI|nr:hypothetical protein HII31_10642 [Pseudocercospora fuligena]
MSRDASTRTGHTITSNVVNGGRVHFGDHYETITYNINYDVYSQHSLDVGSGERIGVLASMPGLLGITGAIQQQLKAFAEIQGVNTSRLYYDASASVSACRLTLESFRRRLTLLDLSSERAALIKVDKLVILFAHAILLFEQLAVILKHSEGRLQLDAKQLTKILARIREQNYAWGLQDFILSR